MDESAMQNSAAAPINPDGVSEDNPQSTAGARASDGASDEASDEISDEASEATRRHTINQGQWDIMRYNGIHMLNLQSEASYTSALAYARRFTPRWEDKIASAYENPRDLALAGWTAADEHLLPKRLRLARLRTALAGNHLPTDLEAWDMKVISHANNYVDVNGVSHAPTHSNYSFLMNQGSGRSTLLWTTLFSPAFMVVQLNSGAPIPSLQHASDLIYLEYYRCWQEDRNFPAASPEGGSRIPAPRNIVVTDIDNIDTLLVLSAIRARMTGTVGAGSPTTRRGTPYPGQVWRRDSEEMHALMGTPVASAVSWFLVHRKHIFGVVGVVAIRAFASDGREDWNLWFEISDL